MKRSLMCVLAFCCFSDPLWSVESWADPGLPVREGIELWLDGSRLGAALAARGLSAPTDGAKLGLWPDASGQRRDLVQAVGAFMPAFRPAPIGGGGGGGGFGFVHFDGVDDRLGTAAPGKELKDFTLFIVASPMANPGGFRCLFSLSEAGRNDYVSGLNVDLGGLGGDAFSVLNAEGSGFSGQRNFLDGRYDFGTFHLLALASSSRGESVQLQADGKPHGSRPRGPGAIRMDLIHAGCRYYSNTQEPPQAQGMFAGDLAEILLYGRALDAGDREKVEAYLQKKHIGLREGKRAPPADPITVLVPGFTVRELPVDLTNLNDLEYEPSGALIALGYDGRVHRLHDSDGDGLEDKVETIWDMAPFRSPLAMALRAEGLYVASHKKISLLVDGDRDGRFDREEIVAEGWVQPQVASGDGVDTLGLAFDGEGNLYFGLGCSDFTNAYLVRAGKAHYDITSERGTILKVSPDRKQREIVCTGIRFPVRLVFNKAGDLFATDQEGETWLPGGNPLDELLHILPGRHYGFPPRHPQHLAAVFDEPSVVNFGPQHQSTCGLVFNDRPGLAGLFGPESWKGDAFVAGYSRGKIWRVRLAKTEAGYVGKASLFAAANLLTLDLELSPRGEMLVACHSGAPDWGTGPKGRGRLFKIAAVEKWVPRPVRVFPNGPMEVRVKFDGLIDPSFAKDLVGLTIEHGEHVRAGDSFEVHRPGYASVEAQLRAARGSLRVAAARVSNNTLILTTDPHPLRASYALRIPSVRGRGESGAGERVEVDYDLGGVEASWIDSSGQAHRTEWLPHLDSDAFHQLTGGRWVDTEDAAILEPRLGAEEKIMMETLQLKTRLDFPYERVVLRLESDVEFESDPPAKDGLIKLRRESGGTSLKVHLKTLSRHPFHLSVSYEVPGNERRRPLPLEWHVLPWAPERRPEPPPPPKPPAALAGGDWERGEAVFFGQEAKCSACHAVRGKGAAIGPDLSNLVHRDAASVYRDIADPNISIHPDHWASTVQLKDGRFLIGLVRMEGNEALRLIDVDAKETRLRRDEVRAVEPASISIMPQGIPAAIGPERMRDLFAFLMGQAPEPVDPSIGRQPERKPEEIAAVRPGVTPPGAAAMKPRPLNVVLVASPKDHGPGEHDYPRWQNRWRDLLARGEAVRVSTAWKWPERAHWDLADVVVLYFWNFEWSDEQLQDLDAFLGRGGGLVVLHSSVIPPQEPDKLAKRVGLAWEQKKTKFRHGALDLKVVAPVDHPITGKLRAVKFVDETYWPLSGDLKKVDVLATAEEEGKPWPILWTHQPEGGGRVFVSILGHYARTFEDPIFRAVLLRAIVWAAREPPERLGGLE